MFVIFSANAEANPMPEEELKILDDDEMVDLMVSKREDLAVFLTSLAASVVGGKYFVGTSKIIVGGLSMSTGSICDFSVLELPFCTPASWTINEEGPGGVVVRNFMSVGVYSTKTSPKPLK
ncbi:hypothetical protein GCK72_022821 [Caenorhabditis remanei]|uniref:Uncharacterized protein n=1 Tax=Caenorhabditis remanei TaxID=31234 RepID=A0A6A5FUV4_CAERE|nr:hypothetical protein GCK72_022821 [Caenorhabditis remanei]KAF1746367.1 hypothetical protein GCK72_022821 [Caenorhabditis remanei]